MASVLQNGDLHENIWGWLNIMYGVNAWISLNILNPHSKSEMHVKIIMPSKNPQSEGVGKE